MRACVLLLCTYVDVTVNLFTYSSAHLCVSACRSEPRRRVRVSPAQGTGADRLVLPSRGDADRKPAAGQCAGLRIARKLFILIRCRRSAWPTFDVLARPCKRSQMPVAFRIVRCAFRGRSSYTPTHPRGEHRTHGTTQSGVSSRPRTHAHTGVHKSYRSFSCRTTCSRIQKRS